LRPAWAEIDLGAIRHNVSTVRARLSPGCEYMAVVKANAYGHGDIDSAKAALEGGATWLGVILVAEARRLRDAGIEAPVLLLHEPAAGDVAEALALGLRMPVFTTETLEAIVAAAERASTTARVHVKVDTGLNRLGVQPASLEDFAALVAKQPRVEVEGVFSHFAIAEEPNHPDTVHAVERFGDALDRLESYGITPAIRHIGSSATALAHPTAHFDLVRVGISTYGIAPAAALEGAPELRPAMTLKARVAMAKRVPAGEGVSYGLRYRLERERTIATIPLGYADGWPRHTTGRTSLLIRGRRYPVVGTICMDSFMADLGDDHCEIGDEVVLIGSQGNERITATEVAEQLGTIAYEVVTGITSRIERVFL
jgi:alanine racemase